MKEFVQFPLLFLLTIISVLSCTKDDDASPEVITDAGDIQTTVDDFRTRLGENNGNVVGSQIGGRRDITWDGLTDEQAVPNGYFGDFFNDAVNGQPKGIEFTTPGMGLIISADSQNPTGTPLSFGNINPQYISIFPPFSGERIFSPLGSNIADIRFYVPGTDTPAKVAAFGAVYIDVDIEESGAFAFYDINDQLIGTYSTPVLNEGHVFLGVIYDNPVIHRVRITYGNSQLGPDDGGAVDVSVMDDFIFSEPQE